LIDPVQTSISTNSLVNQADIAGLPNRIAQAIKTAAAKTGVDFSYLMHKASQESGLDPNAKATTSSATGLFQFTSQTWLRTVKDHGAQYGLGNYADHIQTDSSGVAHVSDPTWRQAILNMRKDPQVSAEMAGELDKENLASLQTNVGGKIGATDLYMAHFLGAGGASDFLNKMKVNPNASAAAVLPDAAAANPSVFYTSSGQPKSLSQIYNHFAEKFDGTSSTMVASASTAATQSSAVLSSKYKATATPVYTLASATTPDTDTAASNYTTPVMSSIKANTSSSLMATMILAQMNMDASGASSSTMGMNAAGLEQQSKKNAINILGSFA
jgi:hypothetical protein